MEQARAFEAFLRCCGSSRWASAMTAERPFDGVDALLSRAGSIWASLESTDWLEAFAAHPRIGEQRSGASWAIAEQSGMASADAPTKARMAQLNAEYQARFGYIFIVCATGKSADEMMRSLQERLAHDADRELRVAADEQRKITALRLAKLVDR